MTISKYIDVKINYHKIRKIKLEPSGVVVPGVVIAGVDWVAVGVLGTKMSYKRCLQRFKSECLLPKILQGSPYI